VGKAKESHCRHAPGGEIVAGRDVQANLPPNRQSHHQEKDDDQEKPGEIAGEEIKPVEKAAEHRAQL
jgi:hypothetical protein